MALCEHIDAHLPNKDFLHKLTIGVNWGLYASSISSKVWTMSSSNLCQVSNLPLTRPQLCLTCANCFHYAALSNHSNQHHNICFAIDTLSASVFCSVCCDYIYSPRLDKVIKLLKLRREEKSTKRKAANGHSRSAFKPLPQNDVSTIAPGRYGNPISLRPRGFRNLGKTCFLNVILQAFIATPLLRSYFLSEKHNHLLCTRDKCTACEFDKLFTQVHQPDTAPLGPTSLLHNLWTAPGASDLAGYAQQDAHEAYISLLNLIHSSCTSSTSHSYDCSCIIHTTFQGTLQSELKCRVCGYASVTSDPFLDVSLDVGSSRDTNGGGGSGSTTNGPKNGKNGTTNSGKNSANHTPPSISPQNLDNCLRRYTYPEPSDWKCTSCSAQASTKQLSFRKLPTVLAFQIKRYEHGLWAQKLDAPVRFPLTLNMRPYTSDDSSEPDEMYLYDLFCVINHLGEMETGHYLCASRFGEQWFRCEDADVSPTSIQSVLDSQGYMLLYIKRTLVYCRLSDGLSD
ncbi:hypothetical protein E3P95_03711 [Wallemia ichthyophaga]|nr:hypothetical protein E3P98_03726 [Wallemia ichthyophaga]TIA95452.1 hypothetical protein E3P95_03711 [Wallemia ichthyophaga]